MKGKGESDIPSCAKITIYTDHVEFELSEGADTGDKSATYSILLLVYEEHHQDPLEQVRRDINLPLMTPLLDGTLGQLELDDYELYRVTLQNRTGEFHAANKYMYNRLTVPFGVNEQTLFALKLSTWVRFLLVCNGRIEGWSNPMATSRVATMAPAAPPCPWPLVDCNNLVPNPPPNSPAFHKVLVCQRGPMQIPLTCNGDVEGSPVHAWIRGVMTYCLPRFAGPDAWYEAICNYVADGRVKKGTGGM